MRRIKSIKSANKLFADWQKKAANIALSLPELNPYIPDDFSLIKSEKKYDHPELIVDESNLRVVYAPSRYFASEPKADVSLICVIRSHGQRPQSGDVCAQ